MFCVIAGHGGVSQVNAFVFSFHMPLFFLISGYFFKPDRAKVWRNTKKLLLAYCWTVVAVIVLSELITLTEVLTKGEDAFVLIKNPLKWIIAGLYGSGSRTDFLGLVLPSIGAVWFFLALAIGGGYAAHYQQVTARLSANNRLHSPLSHGLALSKAHLAAVFCSSGDVCHAVYVRRLQSLDVQSLRKAKTLYPREHCRLGHSSVFQLYKQSYVHSKE